ncbi:MAG: lysoplasmalogenase [Polyangiaceae bacterium]
MLLAWLPVLTALLVLGLLYAECTRNRPLRAVTKTLASVTFVALSASRGASKTSFGLAILVGLVLSFVGDVLLLSEKERVFKAGIFAFLLGHVAFTAAFFVRGVALGPLEGLLVLALLVAGLVLRWLLPHAGNLKGAVILYVVVISVMVPAAVASSVQSGAYLPATGAIAFYFSDLSVARDRFVKEGFVNRLWGLPLYYFAQVLLASS